MCQCQSALAPPISESSPAGKERGKTDEVAMWRGGVAAAAIKVSGATGRLWPNCVSASASALQSPPGLRMRQIFSERADIAHRAVKYDVPRQHIVETRRRRQRVGIGLTQA
jgi:hypothetical protein